MISLLTAADDTADRPGSRGHRTPQGTVQRVLRLGARAADVDLAVLMLRAGAEWETLMDEPAGGAWSGVEIAALPWEHMLSLAATDGILRAGNMSQARSTLSISSAGARAILVAPLRRADGDLIGACAFLHSQSRVWSDADERVLQAMACEVPEILGEGEGTEAKWVQARRYLHHLIGQSPDIVAQFDLEGRHTYVSDLCMEVSGLPADAFVGKTHLDLAAEFQLPSSFAMGMDVLQRAIRSGEPQRYEFEFPTGTGPGVFDVRIAPVFDDEGRVESLFSVTRDVTAQRQAERELARSENEKRALLDSSPDVIAGFDLNLRHTYVSPSIGSTGLSVSDFVGRTHREVAEAKGLGEEFACAWTVALTRARDEGAEVVVRFDLSTPLGEVRSWECRVAPVRDAGAEVVSLLAVGRDVTLLKRAKAEVASREALLRAVIEGSPSGVFVRDPEGRFRVANRAHAELFGFRPEALVGMTVEEVLPADIANRILSGDRQVMDSRLPEKREVRAEVAAGDHRVISLSRAPFYDADGSVQGVVGTSHDITEHTRMENALREANEALQAIIRSSPQGIIALDREGRVTLMNEASERLLGWTEAEVLGAPLPYVPEDAREEHARLVSRVVAGESFTGVEVVRVRRDGQPLRVRVSASPLRGSDGEVRGIMSVLEDVTEKRRIEDDLRASNERFWNMIFNLPLAALVLDVEGRVTLWNRAAEAIFGWTAEEVLGHESPAVPVEIREGSRDIIRAAVAGQTIGGVELRRLRKDGAEIDVEVWAAPLRERQDKVSGVLAVYADITRRKALEAQLRRAQKLEAVGRLAGGIAHDFNNLLTAIQGFADLLDLEADLEGEPAEYVEEIRRAAGRSSRLTQQLLAYSRRQILTPERISLDNVAGEMVPMIERMIGEHVALRTSIDENLPAVLADVGQMEQVLVNLVENARDAMPDGGELLISLKKKVVADGGASAPPFVSAGEYVEMQVGDTGCGMDERTLSRVFEPFFTTKEVGEGSGLGLSTVYGIIKQSGGYVWAESEVGRGSTFHVLTPAMTASAELAIPVMDPDGSPPTAGKTVLLVEDEEALRNLAGTLLGKAGYRVLAAMSPADAVEIARHQEDDLDLVVSDVVMPGMNGLEVVEAVRALHPGVKALFMSGYPDEILAKRGIRVEDIPLLHKPFTGAGLIAAIDGALR